MDIIVKYPKSDNDFEKYYNFRWEILRKPHNKPKGTEKDDLENESFHVMLMDENNIIAVGRIHIIKEDKNKKAQIRYMGVKDSYQKKGVGTILLKELEKFAKENEIKIIVLNARSNAIGFYKKNGYNLIKKTHLLFNHIQHWLMKKNI